MTCFTSAITSCGLRTALISLLAACTGQGHRCIEHERTIEHGIYGEVAYRTLDGGDTPLYQVQVGLSGQGVGTGTTTTETNEDGLFEFALPKMQLETHFTVSSMFASAPSQDVGVTDLARADLVVEEGTVSWDLNQRGECPQ